MSRISEVIKSKRLLEKSQRTRRKEELIKLRGSTAYRASLMDELKHVDMLLSSSDVEAVKVKIPEKMLSQFGEAIYSDELSIYEITQSESEPDVFFIRYKMV